MASAQIFISYRRADAAGYARAVYDVLAQRFGAERVFMDVDDIAAGQAFDAALVQAVGAARVLLVLIGPRWRGERDGEAARIFEPGDFVRLEVAAGLAQGATVIPLLLDGASMPSPAQLPADLHALPRRNALALDNSRFAADIDRLSEALRAALGDTAAAPAPRRRILAIGTLGVVAVAAALAAFWQRRAAPPQRAAVNGRWQATVDYDWPGANYVERFEFTGEQAELQGSASFLRVPRTVLEGSVAADGLRFVTRSGVLGSSAELVHRYRGRLVGDELHMTMQTEGGAAAQRPLAFVARR
jgi:hypothetical protein